MKNNLDKISPEERLFQVIKGDAGNAGQIQKSETRGHDPLSKYLKNKKYYLFAALFLIAAFFPGYYLFNRSVGANNNSPLPIVMPVKSTNPENIVGARRAVPVPLDTIPSESMPPEELIKNLSLVGIAWEDQPRAMIENKITGKTFFVKKGEFLYQLKVEKILVDKIVLDCKGKKFELM